MTTVLKETGSLSRAMGDPHVHACTLLLAIMSVQRDLGKDYILFICFPTYNTVSDRKTVISKYLLASHRQKQSSK